MQKNDVKKYAIILDTNSFGDINKYNFKDGKMVICTNSFKDISNIDVYMPSVVYEELKKHIKESINQSIKEIKSIYLKKEISAEQLDEIFLKNVKQLDEFIEKKNIKILDCYSNANISDITTWYFNQEMPFEPQKPKEFPDAIIISASLNYFKDNAYDEVIAISNDKGFSEGIIQHTKFKVVNDIVEVMQELLNIKDTEIRNCKGYIEHNDILSKLDTYRIESVDADDYYDVSDISVVVNEFDVISKNENDYLVCVNCDIKLFGDFEIIDQDMTVYDNEDPECSAVFYSEGNEIDVSDFDVFISLSFDEKGNIYEYDVVDVDTINLSEYVGQLELFN